MYTRRLEVLARPDVLICGAGCAGVGAAIAAARMGASVLVVDRLGFPGGYMTAVGGAGLDGFIDLRSGLPIVGGVVFDLLAEAAAFDPPPQLSTTRFHASDDLREWIETPNRAAISFNLERFKVAADRLMLDAGAKILYHTFIADVLSKGERISGVVVANKRGLSLIEPKVVVDATGDADIAAWSGAEYDVSADRQPMGLHFRVAGAVRTDDIREKCAAVLQRAQADGLLTLYGGPWISLLESGEFNFNATRFAGDPLDPESLTAGEIRCREDAGTMFALFKEHLVEFEDAHLVLTGPSIGARESRRIKGRATLAAADVAESRMPEDTVVMGAWWLDRHPPDASGYHMHALVRPYGISYQTLLPTGPENLLVAGRCHSADSAALASSRVTITAMGMGQAAGTAAALSVESGVAVADVSTPNLKRQLLADGALIADRAAAILEHGDALGENVPASIPR